MNQARPIIFAGPPEATAVPWLWVRNEIPALTEILIYEQIGKGWFDDDGIGAAEFARILGDVPRGNEIQVRINSPGGNVHDGLAIYNLLQGRRARVTTRVDGVAASIASVIAMAGRELSMPKSALLMIHDPSGLVMGTAEDMRKMASVLDQHGDVIASIYQLKTGATHDGLKELMRQETWLTGEQAEMARFVDRTTNEEAVTAKFDFRAFRRVPPRLAPPPPPPPAPSAPAAPVPLWPEPEAQRIAAYQSPTLTAYRQMRPGRERQEFRRANLGALLRELGAGSQA